MAKHLLTDLAVRKARSRQTAYRLADGDGLYLYVPPSGVKAWQYRYRHNGKQQTATLGKLANLSLAEARERANTPRRLAADGEHVTLHKRVERLRRRAEAATVFVEF